MGSGESQIPLQVSRSLNNSSIDLTERGESLEENSVWCPFQAERSIRGLGSGLLWGANDTAISRVGSSYQGFDLTTPSQMRWAARSVCVAH